MNNRKRRASRSVLLPWERRRALWSSLFAPRRFRATLGVLLLGLLVGFAYELAADRSKLRATRATIAETQRAVAQFRSEVGRCPRSTVELLHPPKTGARYLSDTPIDGWGRELVVRCPSQKDAHAADVISAGPSGSFLEDDNIY